jgi:hypothetical protein
LSNKDKIPIGEISFVILLLFMLLSMIVIIISIWPKSALGQQEQDKSLSFIRHLNSSSYTKVAEDEHFVHEIVYAIREVGDAMKSNSSLCTIIQDIDKCDPIALSLTTYLTDYNFENAYSETEEAKNRLADFQHNPSVESLNDFARANSDVAKSLYELLIKASIPLEGINSLNERGSENVSSTAEISRILIEAGHMVNNDSWISSGEILMTVLSNFEQKYQNINAITGIINSVEVNSLPRNESGLYAIGFGVAGVLVIAGILIRLLSKRNKQNQFGL